MIYVIEFPQQGKPTCWFAFDEEDLARKVYATDACREWEIFDVVTARELLAAQGKAPDSSAARQEFPAICRLADEHGWDTPLYRADYLLGKGSLQVEAVSEADACVAALSQRARLCWIYWSDEQAAAALEGDPLFDSREGFWAREALREQLVSLEVLEGAQG